MHEKASVIVTGVKNFSPQLALCIFKSHECNEYSYIGLGDFCLFVSFSGKNLKICSSSSLIFRKTFDLFLSTVHFFCYRTTNVFSSFCFVICSIEQQKCNSHEKSDRLYRFPSERKNYFLSFLKLGSSFLISSFLKLGYLYLKKCGPINFS